MNDTATYPASTVWIRDLLGLWASRDDAVATQGMGYPTASPYAIADEDENTDDLTGYSTMELEAMNAAVMWLGKAHPDHWRALSREYRPWTRRTLAAKVGDTHLVKIALELLGKHINEAL